MRCFHHPEAEAVGLCKSCSRGICRDCAAEVEGGIACKGRHEAEVELISALIRRNTTAHGRVGFSHYLQLIIYTLGAVGFGLASLAVIFGDDPDPANGVLLLLPTGLLGACSVAMWRWVMVRNPPTTTPAGDAG